MRWRINSFVFCDQTQMLSTENNEQQLEPILVELLSYFCHHPDKIISRDELIESVWLGRIVSDNAVNRAITKLRKCLGDSPKSPKFIATFPKKGYKFIADVERITQYGEIRTTPQTSEHTYSKPKLTKNRLFKFSFVIPFIVISLVLFWNMANDDKPSLLPQLKPLTRASGQEWSPSVSPNQKYLMFVEVLANKMQLYIKQLSDGQKIEVKPSDDPSAWVGPASWSPDGSNIVYLVATKNYCRYYTQSFNQLRLGKPKLIYSCSAGSYGKIAYTHSNEQLIFAERPTANAPYVLFEFDLTTGTKRRLNQPPLILGGNISFDLHPRKNQLLISSPDEKIWEGFYSIDLDTDELSLLFKLDSYICCGIWEHSGERIILMGDHPATQLISYDLQGQDKTVLYSGSQRLYPPERHPNGLDYLLPAGKSNLDVKVFPFNSSDSHHIVNTSVDDRLAIANPVDLRIAFVGLASGNEEIWISDSTGKHQRQLTHFDDQRHYVDLSWSPNGKLLAGLTLNEIHLFDITRAEENVLPLPQAEIRAMSFKDNRTIAFSVKQNEKWIAKRYNIETLEVSNFDNRWQFIHFDANEEDTLWIDQENKIYAGASANPISISGFDKFELMHGRNFNLRKFGNSWYWQKWDNNQYQLYEMKVNGTEPKPILRSDHEHFDVFSEGIIFHSAEQPHTDIFRTVLQK